MYRAVEIVAHDRSRHESQRIVKFVVERAHRRRRDDVMNFALAHQVAQEIQSQASA